MRWFRNPFCRRCLMIRSSVNANHSTFPAGAETVTFVGRPFSLDEAPQHFARLRRWGHTFGASLSLFHACTLLQYPSFTKFVSSSPWRPSNPKIGTLSIPSSTCPTWSSKFAHIMAYTIHPTYAPDSRYRPMRPHGLRRTLPGRLVALHWPVRCTRMDA